MRIFDLQTGSGLLCAICREESRVRAVFSMMPSPAARRKIAPPASREAWGTRGLCISKCSRTGQKSSAVKSGSRWATTWMASIASCRHSGVDFPSARAMPTFALRALSAASYSGAALGGKDGILGTRRGNVAALGAFGARGVGATKGMGAEKRSGWLGSRWRATGEPSRAPLTFPARCYIVSVKE
jgi:hypothetical protein